MILQALNQYYQRLLNDDQSGVSRPGYSKAKVSFALVLSPAGQLLQVIDLREQRKGKAVPRAMDVPEREKGRTSTKVLANFLCDNPGYVLGIHNDDSPERRRAKFHSFREKHRLIACESSDPGLLAVGRFLDGWDPDKACNHAALKNVFDDVRDGGDLVFRLDADLCNVHDRHAARDLWEKHKGGTTSEVMGQCLVTGNLAPIARLHTGIKGVFGAKTSGAPLVSFNIESSTSYGKKKSFNAPVGEPAAFAYTTALNHLLSNERQRLRIGDATTVFWAERKSPAENLAAAFFDPPSDDDGESKADEQPRYDPATTRLIRDILQRARDGCPAGEALGGLAPDVRFFILGLSPNQARLSVRFWFVDTLGRMAERVGRHYADLAIERQFPNDPEFIPLWRILKELAVLGKSENIPHSIESALIRAVLLGTDYPQSLLSTLLCRIRADHEVNYVRAAALKACLLRVARHQNRTLSEAAMTLNEESIHPGYRLGRLFAALEKVQQDAIGRDTNATIRDRYFSSASATPATVFPVLLRLAQHHVAKAEHGRFIDQAIEHILAGLEKFPQRLNLEDQGLFMLGYYHQRNAFYQKHNKDKE